MKDIILQESIEQRIYFLRGEKVMLDMDLAFLYGVTTKKLNQAVKRNKERFPLDFMFKLTKDENIRLRSQNVTLTEKKYDPHLPYAFTEQGVAMLSSVLNSDRAVQVNIQIMRTFTKLRKLLQTHKEILDKLDAMEKRYDKQFRIVFQVIREMQIEKEKPRKQIGFRPSN